MAIHPVDVHPGAIEEVEQAWRWYVEQSLPAARRFRDEVDKAIHVVAESPSRWSEHSFGTRRYRLNRFPFSIVYRVKDERVQVIACAHAKRRPGYWRDRISD